MRLIRRRRKIAALQASGRRSSDRSRLGHPTRGTKAEVSRLLPRIFDAARGRFEAVELGEKNVITSGKRGHASE